MLDNLNPHHLEESVLNFTLLEQYLLYLTIYFVAVHLAQKKRVYTCTLEIVLHVLKIYLRFQNVMYRTIMK